MPDFAAQLCDLLESRLPLTVESDGSEDDWDVVGPAMLAAAGRHLRAIAHLKATFPSGVVSWQLVRSMFEYVATYAWIAAERETRAKRWLKADYQQRLKLDDDLGSLVGERLLDEQNRQRVSEFGPALWTCADVPDVEPTTPPSAACAPPSSTASSPSVAAPKAANPRSNGCSRSTRPAGCSAARSTATSATRSPRKHAAIPSPPSPDGLPGKHPHAGSAVDAVYASAPTPIATSSATTLSSGWVASISCVQVARSSGSTSAR